MGTKIRLKDIAEAEFNDFMETMVPLYIEERSAADHILGPMAEQFARRRCAALRPHGYGLHGALRNPR
jgi:hypothetical protein